MVEPTRMLALATIAIVLSGAATAIAQPAPLPALNVEIKETSVSGLSSGGFAAVQLQVAHSSIIKGAGIVAGGPYDCARSSPIQATTVCSCTNPFAYLCRNIDGATDIPGAVALTTQRAAAGEIDPPGNLASHRVFLFSGREDGKIPRPVMRDLRSYYRNFIPAANVRLVDFVRAGHAMPTVGFGNSCDSSEFPYINRCNYDAAGQILKWIYGRLSPRPSGPLQGGLTRFDQGEFLANPTAHGLDQTGWVFVPKACKDGKACRLHVVLHGCEQGQSTIARSGAPIGVPFGRTFVDNAGYNAWADTNRIVVLYPQAVAIPFNFLDPASANPHGCWDWWGYTGTSYAVKTGKQIQALRAMIGRIASGVTGTKG